MKTALSKRLDVAEARTGAGDLQYCQCPRQVDYRLGITDPEQPANNDTCPRCGLPLDNIPVRLVDMGAPA